MKEVLVPDDELPAEWRSALTTIARRTRAMFVRHPWALVAMLGAPPGPNAMRHFEQCLAVLGSTTLEWPTKFELLAVVDDFVFGHALRTGERRGQSRRSTRAKKAFMDFAKRELETGRYPHTSALFKGMSPQGEERQLTGPDRDDERFERGLQTLLDGAEARMASRDPMPAEKRRHGTVRRA
jgi:hypothetical protein